MTNVSVELCRRIITDIFQALIELSRRSSKEASLCFKNVGYLHLFKNRELAFQQSAQESCTESVRQERSQMRDDLSYIDAASAVLSAGGGRAYSVRSSKISKKSLATAPTNLSIASSKFDKSSKYSTVSQSERKAHSNFGNSRYNNKTIQSAAQSE